MKKYVVVMLMVVFMSFACGGGGGGGGSVSGPTPTDSLSASFLGSSPALGTVTLQTLSVSGSTLYLDIIVTGVDDVFGASINIDYDSSKVNWGRIAIRNSYLERGGPVDYYLALDSSVGEGRLIVGVAGTSAVDGGGTLITVPFRVISPGSSLISFSTDSKLRDGTVPSPLEIPALFSGGTIYGNASDS